MSSDNSDGHYSVLAVHYDLDTEAEMVQHFRDLGFVGIRNMAKDPEPVNCNEARTQVYNAEQQGKGYWFFVGNYDATTGQACRIYRFDCDVVPDHRG